MARFRGGSEALTSHSLSVDRILRTTATADNLVPGLNGFDYTLANATSYDRSRRETLVSDALFDYLTEAADDPGAQVVRYVHQLLYDEAHAIPTARGIGSKRELDADAASTLVSNVRTLGEFSGMLENRSHVFSWPIDGFYMCPSCDATYRSPQDDCRECGFDFVTRAYCRHCSDRHIVTWYCRVVTN